MTPRRLLRAALALPIVASGWATVFVIGASNVSAATTATAPSSSASHSSTINKPRSSSRKHKHERVTCSPGRTDKDGQCQVHFVDKITQRDQSGQTVCFSVTPSNAGTVQTGNGSCTTTNGGGNAFATFQASGSYCGYATINATEPSEHGQTHHTRIFIDCSKHTATTAAALTSASGGPFNPVEGGAALAGVLSAAGAGLAVRRRLSRSIASA